MEDTKEKISRVNIASLILGVLAFIVLVISVGILHLEFISLYLCAVLASILAVIFGAIGVRKKGKMLAIIGLIIGCINLAIELAILLLIIIGSMVIIGTVGGYVGFIEILRAFTSVP